MRSWKSVTQTEVEAILLELPPGVLGELAHFCDKLVKLAASGFVLGYRQTFRRTVMREAQAITQEIGLDMVRRVTRYQLAVMIAELDRGPWRPQGGPRK